MSGLTPKDARENLRGLYRYELEGGWEVLAGRTDADNERLSLTIARPEDWWLHVHGVPGSHVILRRAGASAAANTGASPGTSRGRPAGGEASRELLEQAAAIAAWHSKARAGGVVPVSATRAKHVSKPRGAKEGTVSIEREIKLKVRPGLPPPPPAQEA